MTFRTLPTIICVMIVTFVSGIWAANHPQRNISTFEAVNENLKRLRIEWCSDDRDQDATSDSLFWTVYSTKPRYHKCPQQTQFDACHLCVWNLTGEMESLKMKIFYIQIRRVNEFGNWTESFVVDSRKCVKLPPVQNFTIINLSSRSLGVRWTKTKPEYSEFNVSYQLEYIPQHSASIKLDVGRNHSATLLGLSPSTEYVIMLRCAPSTGGVWSSDKTVIVRTLDEDVYSSVVTIIVVVVTLLTILVSLAIGTVCCMKKYCRLILPIIRPVDDVDDDGHDDDDDVHDGNPDDGYNLIPEELPAERGNELQTEQKPEPGEGLPSDQDGKKLLPSEAEDGWKYSTDGSGSVGSNDDGGTLVQEGVKESSSGVESDDDDEGYAAGKIQ